MSTAAAPPHLLTKYFTADEINFTPGERSFVAWVSVETVDHEGDVVVASGIDYKSVYMNNPVVMCVHDYGKWPAGQCEWLKVKSTRAWTGLYSKAVIDDSPDTEIVWQKIQRRTVRAVSIGFLPPADAKLDAYKMPVEWGPPTADEVKRNPHWKGARRIIRRALMTEFSICPIGMNPLALIEAVSKGLHPPVYATTPEPLAMADLPTPTPEPEPTEAPDGSESTAAPTPDPGAEPGAAAAAAAVTKAVPPPGDDDDDDDDDEQEEGPVKRGHFVRVTKGAYKGMAGKVKSLHRNGPVPDVADDVMATKAMPAARVCAYKAMGSGHVETPHHVGVPVAHLEQTDDLSPPKRKALAAEPPPLPPLAGLTDDQVAAGRLAALRKELSPAALKAALDRSAERAMGAV